MIISIHKVIIRSIKRLLSVAIMSSLGYPAMAFVVNVTNIPEQLIGSPLFITSTLDNRTLDSTRIESSQARLSANLAKPEWCTLNYSYRIEGGVRTYGIPLFLSSDTVAVTIDDYDTGRATASGSPLNDKLMSIQDSLLALTKNRPDNKEAYNELMTKINKFVISEIEENHSNPLGAFLLSSLSRRIDAKEWLDLYDDLSPDVAIYPQLLSQSERAKSTLTSTPGNMFHDLEGIDTEGKPTSLADYIGKGKFVLVDFWAYWCGPCRREAKETLMPLYEKYKDNPDFMILGVMTSDKPENHIAAYKDFNYQWPQMIDSTNSAGKVYGFDAIPFIILFAPDGTIVDRGIRGDQIVKCVDDALNK